MIIISGMVRRFNPARAAFGGIQAITDESDGVGGGIRGCGKDLFGAGGGLFFKSPEKKMWC
jgi:hypothetical protein